MKKLTYIFSLLFLFLFGGVGVVQAQTYNAGDEYTDVPAAGEQFFLRTANGGAYYHGNGAGVTSPDDASLMELEATDETCEGHPVFLLKQVSTGEYLKDYTNIFLTSPGADNTDLSFAVETTPNKDEAFRMVVLRGSEGNSDPRASFSFKSYQLEADANAFVMSNVNLVADQVYYFGWYDGAPFQSPYNDTNAWFFEHAVKATGAESLNKALESYFPNAVSAEEFPEGTDPGEYPAEAINAAKEVYNRAVAKLDDQVVSEEEAAALVAELKSAKENLLAAAAPMRAGTYFVMGHGRNTSAVYDYTYPLKASGNYLVYESGYTVPEQPTIEDAPYIFEVSLTPNGRYVFKSFSDGRYVGAVKTDGEGGNTSLVNTPEAEYEIALQEFSEGGVTYNAFYIALNGDKNSHAFHQANSGGRICGYTSTAFSGAFRFVSVSEEALSSLRGEVEKQILERELQSTITTGSALYNRGRIYKAQGDTHEEDGYYFFDDMGIVADQGQLNSNSIATNEGANGGSPAFLVDVAGNTYYHSVWSGASVDPELVIDLGTPYQDLVLQMARRNAAKNHLSQFHLYASNDSLNWSDEGVYTVNYDKNGLLSGWNGTEGSDTIRNAVALTGFTLSQPYRYLRLLCTGTTDSEYSNGHLMFHMAELRVYEGEFDAAASTSFNAVDPAVREALANALNEAKAALAAGTATQASIDKLNAAIDAFGEQYPMPEKLTAAISTLKSFLDALPFVSDDAQEIGNFPLSLKTSLTEQADKLGMETSASDAAAINAAAESVEAMRATALASIKMPESGQLYILRGATTATADNSGMYAPLYAQGNDENSGVRFMPRRSGTGTGDVVAADSIEDMMYRYNYIWLVENVDQATQTFTLRNVGTGMYLKNNMTTSSTALTTVPTASPVKMVSFYNNASPAFSIVVGELEGAPLYANTTPGGSVVTYTIAGNYSTPTAADGNSSFTFQRVLGLNDENVTYWPVSANNLQIVTLPFAATVYADEGVIYEVLGLNADDNTLELSDAGGSFSVEAGQGFVLKAGESQNYIMAELSGSGLPAYSFQGISKNGITGNVLRTTVDGAGIRALSLYNNGSWWVRAFADNTQFGGNSGYFHGLPMTAEKGDLSIGILTIDFITGIENVTAPAAQDGKVFDLSGRRVQKAQKGLYIINGKKVLVK